MKSPLPRKRLTITMVVLTFVEWLLFELIRTPYRPPHDMSTLLGTEKYLVIDFMAMLAILELAILGLCVFRFTWSNRDIRWMIFLLGTLAGAVAYAVINHGWPVTPLEWVLH